MKRAFIALGSNLDTREQFLSEAIGHLERHPEIQIVQKSSVYETAPVGYTDQSDFLNMVALIRTSLSPAALLDYCQSIEADLGRKRVVKWGPRTIDLDILLYDDESVEEEHLTIPHPHMHERAFVMVPLADVDPDVIIPRLERSAKDVIAELPEEDVQSMRVWGEIQ
ncbi:2-amino-4-hydroxy-6-hydroxymethyldihydropteridine diphosphokinase [Halobacillus fulvus]|nr:2-amino-4-hydroxy-6-hydroxymethyldihydropteridine diphosphokinase [Halobacillus fulvus]